MPETKEELTLAERLSQVTKKMASNRKSDSLKPIGCYHFCIICHRARIRPDPTGITCGEEKCLSEVGTQFSEQKEETEELKRVTEKIGIDLKKIANRLGLEVGEMNDPEDVIDVIKDKLPDILNVVGLLKKISEKMGLDPSNNSDDLFEGIDDIKGVLTEIIQSLGLRSEDLSGGILGLCEVIQKEISEVVEKIKEIEESSDISIED